MGGGALKYPMTGDSGVQRSSRTQHTLTHTSAGVAQSGETLFAAVWRLRGGVTEGCKFNCATPEILCDTHRIRQQSLRQARVSSKIDGSWIKAEFCPSDDNQGES